MASRTWLLSSKQPGEQLVATYLEMLGDIIEDSSKRADPNWIVSRNGYMMLTVLCGCQPKMAAALSRNLVAKESERLKLSSRLIRRVAVSCGDHFFTNKMQADYLWTFTSRKMTAHRVPHLATQSVDIVSLGKDRSTQSPRCVTAFGRIFDEKD
jgi:hypothetical protein